MFNELKTLSYNYLIIHKSVSPTIRKEIKHNETAFCDDYSNFVNYSKKTFSRIAIRVLALCAES